MRVTAKQGANWGPVELLTYFLNLDLDSVYEEDLKGDLILGLYLGRRLGSMLESPKGRTEFRQLQSEIRQDLLPIVAPEKEYNPDEAYSLLEKLVEKINKMGLKREWGVVPVTYGGDVDRNPETGDAIVDPKTGRVALTFWKEDPEEAKRKAAEYATAGERVLKILGAQWVVKKGFKESRSLREFLYWKIIDALESGTLSRLKVCSQCRQFFAQADARQEFCSDHCRVEFNNKHRLESGYFSALRQKKRAPLVKKARRLLREGKTPAKVADETGLSLRILRREGLVR